jgi:glucose-6-phosphate 1-epimerase
MTNRTDSTPDTLLSLNATHAIPNIAAIVPGTNNLPKIHITLPTATADIYLHGAQVTSWHPTHTQQDVLFLSSKSLFQEGKAIRGGIPVCWPWFRAKADNPAAPSHGLVRTKSWTLDSISHNAEDATATIALSTGNTAETEALWPYAFHLKLCITVGATLQLELSATNTGTAPFTFEEALHTYFHTADIHAILVRGLADTPYLDNTDNNREKSTPDDLTFNAPTDNAYLDTEVPLEVVDPGFHRTLRTEKVHARATVAWNPWREAAAKLPDLADDEWTRMACVEAANIRANAIRLAPGEHHTMISNLSVLL